MREGGALVLRQDVEIVGTVWMSGPMATANEIERKTPAPTSAPVWLRKASQTSIQSERWRPVPRDGLPRLPEVAGIAQP